MLTADAEREISRLEDAQFLVYLTREIARRATHVPSTLDLLTKNDLTLARIRLILEDLGVTRPKL